MKKLKKLPKTHKNTYPETAVFKKWLQCTSYFVSEFFNYYLKKVIWGVDG